MISEDDYEESSGDFGVDFARLESKFRVKLQEKLDLSDNNYSFNAYSIEYINHTLAAADAFGLDLFEGFQVPYPNDKNIGEVSQRVQTIVDSFKVRVNLSRVNGRSTFSVRLSIAEKGKIRHWAEQIRSEIESSRIDDDVKRDLLDALNVFLAKLDRDRTPLQAFTDFVLTTSATAGVAADNLDSWWKWVPPIAAVFGLNLQSSQSSLPKQKRQLQLEDKRSRFGNKPLTPPDEDEIPF